MSDGLRIRGLDVRYDRVEAVVGLDLDVRPGEIVAVLGRSGSGKTSVLRSIAGLVQPAAGTIHWDGEDVTALKPHKRGFGLMLSGSTLFPQYSAARNIVYGLDKWPRHDRARRAAEVSARLGIEDLGRASVSTLSEGQAQRVGLARVIAPRPRLLLLDEPLGGVEGDERRDLIGRLVDAVRREDIPVAYVTHAVDEALRIADRVVVLDAGRVAQEGLPTQIQRNPATRRVAEYFGYGPFVQGAASGDVVECELGTLRNPGFSGPVLVGLNSQGLIRVAAGGAGQTLRVRGERARAGYTEISVRLPDGQTARFHSVTPVQADEVTVALDPAGCAIVPAERGAD